MRASDDEALAELWERARPTTAAVKTAEEAVILASIVEKETGVAAERPQVAAVFINRCAGHAAAVRPDHHLRAHRSGKGRSAAR